MRMCVQEYYSWSENSSEDNDLSPQFCSNYGDWGRPEYRRR